MKVKAQEDAVYNRVATLSNYHRRMEYFRELLGNYCWSCGKRPRKHKLQFDHIDPLQKSFTIGGSDWCRPIAVTEKELEKCQLLCKDCHRTKTNADAVVGRIAPPEERRYPKAA